MSTEEFKEKYEKIKGMDKLFLMKDDFSNWSYFHKIQSIRVYREYDYEEWYEVQNAELELIASDKSISITLLFREVWSLHLHGLDRISGFDIVYHEEDGTGNQNVFEILDFEENDMHFFCKEVRVLAVKPFRTLQQPI